MSALKSTFRRWLLRLLYLFLLFASFAAGVKLAWHYVWIDGTDRLRDLDKSRRELCQAIYFSNSLHAQGINAERGARLTTFDTTRGRNTLKLSYSSALAGDCSLTLNGNSTLVSETKSGTRTIAVIDPDRCKALFHEVLTGGFMDYSEEVIEMKERLDEKLGPRNTFKHMDDGCYVKIQLTAPELEVDKSISIYEPEVALENHPDIIEFRLFIELEKEIMSLVPENDPDWHR